MSGGTVAGWYPDPHNPAQLRYWDGTVWAAPPPKTHGSPASKVFTTTLLYGIVIGLLTGAIGGTAAVPVLGTIAGAFMGLPVGLVVGLIMATAVSAAARPEVSAAGYRRTVDVTLGIVGLASAVFGGLLIIYGNDDDYMGLRTGVTIIIVAVVGLVIARPRLRKLATE
jgi:hypothetical protein